MRSYGEKELAELITSHESDLIEFKESLKGDAPAKIREAVCAFSNDLPNHKLPGVIFVGIDDSGSPTGLPITDDLLRTLADIKTDGNILPPPAITVTKHHLLGAEIAVLTVLPSDSPPVRYKGRIWVRVGPRRATATSQDERILSEKRRFGDRPFDARPVPSASLEDLSREVFEGEYLPSAFAPDVLEANDRSLEQRLSATKMIVTAEEPTPTVLGVLVLSQRTRDYIPGAYVQFLRIRGESLSDPIIDEAAIDGTAVGLLRRLEEKIEAHVQVSIDLTSASREVRQADYPKAALQQFVRNAVMHRSYERTNAPIRVSWYDDRIEITSPGGPYGSVSKDNFGQPGVTDYRNPNLAEALRVLGFVQRFGVGIATAQRLLRANGNPPAVFTVEPTLVSVTLRKAT